MKTAAEKIAVMQAYERGEKIELFNGVWVDCCEPVWNWDACNYRIAPKPLECLVVTLNERLISVYTIGTTLTLVDENAKIHKMREVIE